MQNFQIEMFPDVAAVIEHTGFCDSGKMHRFITFDFDSETGSKSVRGILDGTLVNIYWYLQRPENNTNDLYAFNALITQFDVDINDPDVILQTH